MTNIRTEQAKQRPITVHWWNCGTKTLDYKGTIQGYLESKGITYSEIMGTIHFRIPLATETATFQTRSDFYHAALDAIRIFCLLLGDKTTIETDRDVWHVNWA